MTEAVLLTGKRGTGKSLNAVRTIQQYMREGRIVATNLDLFIEKLLPAASRALSYRLPDVPSAELLNHPLFPKGNPNPVQEERNGLLVLDECAGYLNAREWKDKDRTGLIHWLAQSRKEGWDLLLIAQGASMIDKQIRQELCDVHGVCRETSKIGIPLVTWFMRSVFGVKVMMPKFYVVSYFYGFGANAVRSFTDMFRSSDVCSSYNTLQKISGEFGQQGLSCNLSAWHLRGRYLSRWEMYGRIVGVTLAMGFIVGCVVGWFGRPAVVPVQISKAGPVADKIEKDIKVTGKMVNADGAAVVVLSDGRVERAQSYKKDLTGAVYKVGGQWYAEGK